MGNVLAGERKLGHVTQHRRICVFCGGVGSSREDVLPLWASEVLSDGAPFTLRSTNGRDKEGLQSLGVYSWAACRTCNNEWMSGMEATVKPLILPAMRGEKRAWSTLEQRDIAAWAFKTALMIDRSSLAAGRVPKSHFEYLHEHRRPPGSVQIRTAFYRPDAGEEQHGATIGVGNGDRERFEDSYRVVFSLGCLVFEVHGRGDIDDLGLLVETYAMDTSGIYIPLENSYSYVWPARTESAQWPPEEGFALNSHSLLALTDEPLVVPWIAPLAA